MLKSIFSKTLYEKRWAVLWWSIAMFAMTVLIVALFPVFRDSFGASLQDVPDSLKQILGDASDYQRLEGFLELQVYMQMVFLTFVYGIILFTGLLAGEEGAGTLQTLLAQPVSRSKVYFQKLLAGMVILAVLSFALFLGIVVGAASIGESIHVWRNVQATFAQWLVALVFSLVGYFVGAATGRRGIAGTVAGSYAFAAYMVSSLVQTAEGLKMLHYASPFRYFNNPRVLEHGLLLSNIVVLTIAVIVLVIAGWLRFCKRDIYQRS